VPDVADVIARNAPLLTAVHAHSGCVVRVTEPLAAPNDRLTAGGEME
jgi:hypothetical protein